MHCSPDRDAADRHTEAVFQYVIDLMEQSADDHAVAEVLSSLDTLLVLGHQVTREDLVAVFFAVRQVFTQDLGDQPDLAELLDRAQRTGLPPDVTLRLLDQRPDPHVPLAALVSALRLAAALPDAGPGTASVTRPAWLVVEV